MSARTRNAHLAAIIAFGKWYVDSSRLVSNPFSRISKANEKADPQSLHVSRALNAPPALPLGGDRTAPQGTIQGDSDESSVAVTSVKTSHNLSIPVMKSAVDAAMEFTADDTEIQVKSMKHSPFSSSLSNGDKKRAKGFEPSTYSLGSCHSTN
jgi:hypothetical protein